MTQFRSPSLLSQERALGKKSFWEPYMRILPVKYANMPGTFLFTRFESVDSGLAWACVWLTPSCFNAATCLRRTGCSDAVAVAVPACC